MMESNNIATLSDKRHKHDISVEVNKNEKDQDYVEFKVKDSNGEWIKSYIDIKELYGLTFMLVGEKEQGEMMPVRKTEVRVYERQHKIQLSKNMKKGEIVVANCRVEVPLIVEEGLYGLIKKRAKQSSGIIVPSKRS